MLDRAGLAGRNARQRGAIADRFAGGAGVFDIFSLSIGHDRNWFFPEGVIRIFTGFEYPSRASRHTVVTSVALVGINRDEEFARTIRVTVVGKHPASSVSR